jgi:hypothetical protein
MTRIEAKQAIEQGEKVTHNLFPEGEFITKFKGSIAHYTDKEGAIIKASDFWLHRQVPIYDNGWNIVNIKMTKEEYAVSTTKISH